MFPLWGTCPETAPPTPPTPHRWEGYPTLTRHWISAIFCPFFSLSSLTPMGYSRLAFPWTEVLRVRVVRDWTWSRRTLVLGPSDWSKNRELLAFIYPAFLSSQERTALCISHMALCRLSLKPQHPACLLAHPQPTVISLMGVVHGSTMANNISSVWIPYGCWKEEDCCLQDNGRPKLSEAILLPHESDKAELKDEESPGNAGSSCSWRNSGFGLPWNLSQ